MLTLIFTIIIFILSVVIHEVSHGFVAEKLGDPTARNAGRLTLNPLKHLDLLGSVILPLILAIPRLFGYPSIIVGWAKPVPYNPHNLKNPEKSAAIIAAAGPISNLLLAVVFGLLMRFNLFAGLGQFFATIVFVNILLAVFNLIPIPPLDGSKILFMRLSEFSPVKAWLQVYGLVFIFVFIFIFGNWIFQLTAFLFKLISGLPLAL